MLRGRLPAAPLRLLIIDVTLHFKLGARPSNFSPDTFFWHIFKSSSFFLLATYFPKILSPLTIYFCSWISTPSERPQMFVLLQFSRHQRRNVTDSVLNLDFGGWREGWCWVRVFEYLRLDSLKISLFSLRRCQDVVWPRGTESSMCLTSVFSWKYAKHISPPCQNHLSRKLRHNSATTPISTSKEIVACCCSKANGIELWCKGNK